MMILRVVRKWKKKIYRDYCEEKQIAKDSLNKYYQKLLDVLLELNYAPKLSFNEVSLEKCVDNNYAIDSEKIPTWLEEWISVDRTNRVDFLLKFGYNGVNSPIVNLRKSMISENYNEDIVIKYYTEIKDKQQLAWNTVEWLSKHNTDIITQNIDTIRKITEMVNLQISKSRLVTIPVIQSINSDNERIYALPRISIGTKISFLSNDTEYANDIYSAIKQENDGLQIIDNSIGTLRKFFNIENIELQEEIDEEQLENNSTLWEELFYKKWSHYKDYAIYIYDGNEIPYKRTFNEIFVNTFTKGFSLKYNEKYYVSKKFEKDILSNLGDDFPNDKLNDLISWENKTLRDSTLLDEDSFEYNERIDRIIQDRFGISNEKQKTESESAKVHTIYFLKEQGFDISDVEDNGWGLSNVIDNNGNNINVIVRRAKGGLLYLDKEHWNMLEENKFFLAVVYPGNEPKLFKNKQELLGEELSKNLHFRIKNNRNVLEIDNIFEKLK